MTAQGGPAVGEPWDGKPNKIKFLSAEGARAASRSAKKNGLLLWLRAVALRDSLRQGGIDSFRCYPRFRDSLHPELSSAVPPALTFRFAVPQLCDA